MGDEAPVYEMLWDCGYCSTKKLLGLTHRHCPVCGAPQNPEARYFPPESEKKPVHEHVYYGADLECAACKVPNSKHSKHCRNCGAPLEGAREVARRPDQRGDTPFPTRSLSQAPRATPEKRKTGCGAWGCAVIFFAVIALVLVAVLWKKPGELEVVGHRWERSIEVERFGPVEESAWCDSVPARARVISRSRAVRDHRRIEDGEECSTRKVDNGDGTYSEHRECTPRYRDEPVYDTKCRYLVMRWAVARSERAEGRSTRETPRWPALRLGRTGQCDGCEREGSRRERYTVELRDAKGRAHTCNVPFERWQSFADGSHYTGKMAVVTGALDCASLTPQAF